MYILNTWFVANLLHPVAMLLIWQNEGNNDRVFAAGFMILIYSICLSLPSLFMSWGLMELVQRLKVDDVGKFFIWLVLVSGLPIINAWLIEFLLIGEVESIAASKLVWPACVAVAATVVLRITYFFKHLETVRKERERSSRSMNNP